eukprot:15894-Heterococcus_DN1.PRE.1
MLWAISSSIQSVFAYVLGASLAPVPLAGVGAGAYALSSTLLCSSKEVQLADVDAVQAVAVDELQQDELADDVLLSLERSSQQRGLAHNAFNCAVLYCATLAVFTAALCMLSSRRGVSAHAVYVAVVIKVTVVQTVAAADSA